MRKLIACLLTLSLAAGGGCGHSKLPESSQRRLDYENQLEMERARAENPDYAAAEDDSDDTIISAVITFAALPFVFIVERIRLARGITPAKAAREMNDPNADPDTHRQGMADLVTSWTFTHRPPYTTRYKQIAEHDPNDTVRAMAIRALNISRDASATPIFIAALEDDSELVRLEAVKALNNIPDENAVPALLRRLQGRRDPMLGARSEPEESKDVRIAAADALRHYHTLEVARELVNQLGERDFGIAWQSNRSLMALTGRNYKYDESAWLQFLTGPEKPFG